VLVSRPSDTIHAITRIARAAHLCCVGPGDLAGGAGGAPKQSEFSKHGLRSLQQPQCLFRLLFLRWQRPEQCWLSRSQRSPFRPPHAASLAATLGVDVSARPESATEAQPNPQRPMTSVRTSKWSVSIGRHLESDERRLWQRGTLTAAYLGVGNRPRAVPRSPVEPRSAARRGCGGEFLRGIRQGRLRRELRRQGNTGMDHFHPGAPALPWGAVWAPGFRAGRR
jgi:hypothetical protein